MLRSAPMRTGDYYDLLGILPDASAAEIKKAWHRLALQHHPDRNAGDPAAADRFRQILEAYEVLSDPGKRTAYDAKWRNFSFSESLPHPEYLKAEVDTTRVKLNEEVELTFSYPGEGRFFRKPVLQGWEITAGPTVGHRFATMEGQTLRETVLHYTVCPLRTGLLTIPVASIRFHHHPVTSDALQVEVSDNACYFKKGEAAGSSPYPVMMHRLQVTSTSVYRKTILHQRKVLLPRSALAAWYHKVGRIMKISFAVLGAVWAMAHGESMLLGLLAGSLLAGINVHLMYRAMGIRSLFYYAQQHPLVQEYLSCGYQLGAQVHDGLFSSRRWDDLRSLFI
ncbi:MAG: DnaJ domain-containing protein [Bacteroidia bacterium]|nr:DnaJ domain-containing protein [Bacteroidia bacterium]